MGLVDVITYKGKVKSEDGKEEKEVSCTAGSAKEVIDPTAIETAVQGVVQAALEGARSLSKNISDLGPMASEGLKVNDINMVKLVEGLSQAVGTTAGTVANMLSNIPQDAEDLHNKLQRQANKEAREALEATGATDINPKGYE